MKKRKIITSIALVITLVISAITIIYADTVVLDGYKQVTGLGGNNINKDDGVEISKTIEETELENYFDITLKVKTQSEISEILTDQDLAIVLVLDISNTMNNYMENSDTTRIKAATASINSFLEKFQDNSSDSAIRKIGMVTFNRDANTVFGMTDCKTTDELNYLKGLVSEIKEAPKTEEIKWTNMEAGLTAANNLLNSDSVKDIQNKYIIFLTDGLPTTYIKSGTTGYTPKYTGGMVSAPVEGKFIDFVNNVMVKWGCNYSDLGARKAEELAYSYKQKGIKIFSIGVGISTQDSLKKYLIDADTFTDKYDSSGKLISSAHSTIDTDTEDNNYTYYSTQSVYQSKGGRYFAVAPGINTKITENASNYDGTTIRNAYKNWLGDYIGSGKAEYYYDSDNVQALSNAYDSIFAKIKSYIESSSEATWVAEDPMNTAGTLHNIEFVGMYNDESVLVESLPEELNDYNTATFAEDKISWDLKKSSYETETKTVSGKEVTTYLYTIKYRVRLTNENTSFIENKITNTNGETLLTYVTRKSDGALSDNKSLSFPIPSVIGYLGELKLTKISSYDNKKLENAKFTLTHSSDCPCLEERKHIEENFMITTTSNKSGELIFERIPSGHVYTLTETSAPDNHTKDTKTYKIIVSYDSVTGDLPTNNIIKNNIITKNLTLKKLVEGNAESSGEFTFQINIEYDGKALLDGTYGSLSFKDGKAQVKLENNEEITISNIPSNAKYSITEINADGYLVEYEIDGKITEGETAEGIIKDKNIIKFINTGGYILPETGSSGSLILLIVGSLLLIVPIIYIIYVFRNERKVS